MSSRDKNAHKRAIAEKVAEYLSLAPTLKPSDSTHEYRRANQLAFELAILLPAEIYKSMAAALIKPTEAQNRLVVIIAVRAWLLDEPTEDFGPDNVLQHAPGIGRK
jgi:hypothetical protein